MIKKNIIIHGLAFIMLSLCVFGTAAAAEDRQNNSGIFVPEGKNFTDFKLYGAEIYAITEDGRVITANVEEGIRSAVEDWTKIIQIEVNDLAVFGLHGDGTVSFCMRYSYPEEEKQYSEVLSWNDITAISGWVSIVGLKRDGTVVSAGPGWFGSAQNYDLSGWSDVVKIQVIHGAEEGLIALRSDGTVLTLNADVFGWTDEKLEQVTDFSCAPYVWLCLNEDGTVQASGENIDLIKDEIPRWKDIDKVCAGPCAAGIKKDGTVVTAGWLEEPDLSDWKNIRELVSHPFNEMLIGIGEDGSTHCCVGKRIYYPQINVEEIERWTGIEKICFGRESIVVGLRQDGSLVGCKPISPG